MITHKEFMENAKTEQIMRDGQSSRQAMYEILVPANWNDGKRISLLHHLEFDKFVEGLSGGLTIYKSAQGTWTQEDTGRVFKEDMIPVRIMCNREQIEQIIDFTLVHYQQIAVMAYKVSDEVIVRQAHVKNS